METHLPIPSASLPDDWQMWLAMILFGAFHGVNPGMGWLFALTLGLQRRSERIIWLSLLLIALGHALAIIAVLLLVFAGLLMAVGLDGAAAAIAQRSPFSRLWSLVLVLLVTVAVVAGAAVYMAAPVIEQLASENAGAVKVGKLNVDNSPTAAQNYGVSSIPTLMLFKDGEVVERFVGVQPKSRLQEAMDAAKA